MPGRRRPSAAAGATPPAQGQPEEAQAAAQARHRARRRLALAAVLVAVCIFALDSPVRRFTGGAGASLRDLLFLAAILLAMSVPPRSSRAASVRVLAVCAITFHFLVGVFAMGADVLGISQAMFGLKMLLPFFAGWSVAEELMGGSRRMIVAMLVLMGVTAAGLVLDYQNAIDFLKVKDFGHGSGYVSYYAGSDLMRLAGFSRMYSIACVLLAIPLLLLLTYARRPLAWIALSAMTAWPIWLTNAKTTIGAVAILAAIQMLPTRIAATIHQWLIVPVAIANVALPIVISGLFLHAPGAGAWNVSIWDRLMNTWPGAWRLMFDSGLGPLGRGLGGIGAPQMAFAPERFNAGDSLFLYLFAYFGIFSIAYLAIALALVLRVRVSDDRSVCAALMILTLFLIEGLTAGMLEEPLGLLMGGAALGYLAPRGIVSSRRLPALA